jgi:transcriptional regulator with XRE-family HTH domain
MLINNMDQFYQEIGSRIRNARLLSGISQEILAAQLGLTRASIINIEKGRHRPSVHLLIEIVRY